MNLRGKMANRPLGGCSFFTFVSSSRCFRRSKLPIWNTSSVARVGTICNASLAPQLVGVPTATHLALSDRVPQTKGEETSDHSLRHIAVVVLRGRFIERLDNTRARLSKPIGSESPTGGTEIGIPCERVNQKGIPHFELHYCAEISPFLSINPSLLMVRGVPHR